MKKDNKGFSLVELIVVVAIMAVLMVVVTPALLRYVEKTRLQRDNSAIAEVANAAKIACASEGINKEVAGVEDGVTVTLVDASGDISCSGSATKLQAELRAAMGKITLSSNTYEKNTTPTLVVEVNEDMAVTVTGKNIILDVSDTTGEDYVY